LLLTLAVAGTGVQSSPARALADSAATTPSVAEGVYSAARSRLLQIRTLVSVANKQSVIGSGFLVSADGLAITNYHVVSQYALEPQTYRLEYVAADGSVGPLTLLAIDLADDLAVVRVDHRDLPFFEFDKRALADALPKGERLYSMGNPLDLGFTIVEGTYNGLVERSYSDRIHFSGAINPGMSGGPTVTADGRVVGINVAKLLGGDLVSFLVPARFAAALLTRAASSEPPSPRDLKGEIGRQLTLWQAGLYKTVLDQGFHPADFGPYEAPESAAPWFTCWAQTNADQVPKPRATVNTTSCSSDTRLFVASDLSTGLIYVVHSHIRSVDLNQFQFAAFVSRQSQSAAGGSGNQKWRTARRCDDDFVAAAAPGNHPPLRVLWCARAYREFDGLYDVSVMTVTQDRGNEALVSRLSLQGVSYDNAIGLAKHFIDAVQWTK